MDLDKEPEHILIFDSEGICCGLYKEDEGKMSDSGKQIGDCQHGKNPAWCVECLRQAVEERIADEKFVVRARQAFGIMMHRGWHAVRRNTGDWKIGEFLARDSEFLAWTRKHFFIDPFTCLIEADKWMVEREQSK